MEHYQRLLDYIGHLPECPVWDEQTGTLYWADILEKEIHSVCLSSSQHRIIRFPEEVGCFALRKQGGFIVALRSAIWLCSENGTLIHKVCDNPNNPQLARFNDGGTDREGRFYAGTFWAPGDYHGALLMRIDAQLRPQVIQCDLRGANGLSFSPDNRWMFNSDSPERVVYKSALAASGEPGPRTVFRQFSAEEGLPDGAAVDVEGGYWVAFYGGGRIARFSADGTQLEEHLLPVPCPTMICFGGEGMRTLFITTTRENMTPEECMRYPLSGAIFRLDVAVAGIAATKFPG